MNDRFRMRRAAAAVMWAYVIGSSGTAGPVHAADSTQVQPPGDGDEQRLQAEFERMLTGAVLTGTWQMTRGEGLEGKGPLSDAAADKYEIRKVTKLASDHWLVTARIVYADHDVTVPVPVRVVWAGDTPVITVDTRNIPMLGEYSARVMVYRNFYAGTWFGRGYGGVMSGQITHPEAQNENAVPNPNADPVPDRDSAPAAANPNPATAPKHSEPKPETPDP